MQPGVKYSIVSRDNGSNIGGYIIDNTYYASFGSSVDKRFGVVIDGFLRHRNPASPDAGDSVLRVDGLTLIDEQGSVFDLVAQ